MGFNHSSTWPNLPIPVGELWGLGVERLRFGDVLPEFLDGKRSLWRMQGLQLEMWVGLRCQWSSLCWFVCVQEQSYEGLSGLRRGKKKNGSQQGDGITDLCKVLPLFVCDCRSKDVRLVAEPTRWVFPCRTRIFGVKNQRLVTSAFALPKGNDIKLTFVSCSDVVQDPSPLTMTPHVVQCSASNSPLLWRKICWFPGASCSLHCMLAPPAILPQDWTWSDLVYEGK